MAKSAVPYQDGTGWCLRRRILGQNLYVSGYRKVDDAVLEMDKMVSRLRALGKPKGLGPMQTTLAKALQEMGLERLPFMKGAVQEARRINRYLECAGLALLKVSRAGTDQIADAGKGVKATKSGGAHFVVKLEAPAEERAVPKGLDAHRRLQASNTRKADRQRARLARMKVGEIQPSDMQLLINELRLAHQPATVHLERALLRGFFNFARDGWSWSEPPTNPAARLTMPTIDNGRTRVMSVDEQQRLEAALKECRNPLVGPMVTLLTETAMRSSEPLEQARWMDVDWDAKVLHLRDSKSSKRDVPLSPVALDALRALQRINPPEPEGSIVQMSYEALKAAWLRLCERAEIKDLRLHDLRHTAATRMALQTGNVFIVKALTGHKTMSQVQRYVNVKASDVVAVMHANEPKVSETPEATSQPEPTALPSDDLKNAVRGDLKKRRCA